MGINPSAFPDDGAFVILKNTALYQRDEHTITLRVSGKDSRPPDILLTRSPLARQTPTGDEQEVL
jgi:hypothetical protein